MTLTWNRYQLVVLVYTITGKNHNWDLNERSCDATCSCIVDIVNDNSILFLIFICVSRSSFRVMMVGND